MYYPYIPSTLWTTVDTIGPFRHLWTDVDILDILDMSNLSWTSLTSLTCQICHWLSLTAKPEAMKNFQEGYSRDEGAEKGGRVPSSWRRSWATLSMLWLAALPCPQLSLWSGEPRSIWFQRQ